MECNSNQTLKELYKDAKPYEDPSAEIHSRAIFDFNKMLRGGQMKPLDCYRWLDKKRQQQEDKFAKAHGFRMDFSFNYLYPEVIGPMPDTYEEWKEGNKKDRNESWNGIQIEYDYGMSEWTCTTPHWFYGGACGVVTWNIVRGDTLVECLLRAVLTLASKGDRRYLKKTYVVEDWKYSEN